VCSIGGNVAENSGGAHCFKYGFTANYVTGLEVVLRDGEVVQLGGNDERIELPGLGLLPMSDDPELVARTIAEFVGRVREPAAGGS
jgi:FAD/FMN-containing dehydrogenase